MLESDSIDSVVIVVDGSDASGGGRFSMETECVSSIEVSYVFGGVEFEGSVSSCWTVG